MMEIENERRSKSYPCLPYLSTFIRFMSNGKSVMCNVHIYTYTCRSHFIYFYYLSSLSTPSFSLPCLDNGVFVSGRDKCWDRVEVSSNEYRKMRMLDGDLSTHWESSGSEGSHWIRLHMIKNVVVRYGNTKSSMFYASLTFSPHTMYMY